MEGKACDPAQLRRFVESGDQRSRRHAAGGVLGIADGAGSWPPITDRSGLAALETMSNLT